MVAVHVRRRRPDPGRPCGPAFFRVVQTDQTGAGWTTEQVLENYPHLTPESLQAVFAFAAETADEVRLLPLGRDAA